MSEKSGTISHEPEPLRSINVGERKTVRFGKRYPRICSLSWILICNLFFEADVLCAEWPQFRGPNSSGIAIGAPSPVEFGPGKNELWRLPLESGHSSPCVAGDAIFVTTYDKELKKLAVVCIDRFKGEIRWQNDVPTDHIEKGHPSFNPASSSPTTDGERVVAYFGSFGLVCFDMDGVKMWEFKMPLTKSFAGNATSPAIFGDRVILYRGNHVDHFLLAVDKLTGKEIWRVPQQERFTSEMSCTACPILSGDKLIIHSARSVQAIDISNGKQIWFTKCATTATSTPVLAGNEVVVAAWNKMGEPELRPEVPGFDQMIDEYDQDGDKMLSRNEFPTLWLFHRPQGAEAPMNGGTISFGWADHNRDREIAANEWPQLIQRVEGFRSRYDTHGILAIQINSNGLVAERKLRTLSTRGIPEVPSPLYHKGYIYFVKNGGLLTCLELKTGKPVYQERTKGQGTHYASPLIADDKLYTFSGEGRISVLTLGPDPEILSINDMADLVYATPAIVDGTIYVRTHSTLFAFREENYPK